jgi:hypothetical protein
MILTRLPALYSVSYSTSYCWVPFGVAPNPRPFGLGFSTSISDNEFLLFLPMPLSYEKPIIFIMFMPKLSTGILLYCSIPTSSTPSMLERYLIGTLSMAHSFINYTQSHILCKRLRIVVFDYHATILARFARLSTVLNTKSG